MKNKKIIFAILLVLLPILACQGTSVASEGVQPPEEVYLGLRNMWFTMKPEDMDTTFVPEDKVPMQL